jgi:hypothetical protein
LPLRLIKPWRGGPEEIATGGDVRESQHVAIPSNRNVFDRLQQAQHGRSALIKPLGGRARLAAF